MRIIGIDPGERWVGFAAFDMGPSGVRVDSRVYDARVARDTGTLGTSRDISWYVMANMLVDLLPPGVDTRIVIEDYRVRPVGHQAFSAADVPRMIGALTQKALSVDMFDVAFVQPTDNVALADELLGATFSTYRAQWPRAAGRVWQHARSAWRVVAQHMLERNPRALERVRGFGVSLETVRWLPLGLQPVRGVTDVYAPAHKWY